MSGVRHMEFNKGRLFAPLFLPIRLVKANSGGPWTDVLARIPGRNTPYAKFLVLLAVLYDHKFSRKWFKVIWPLICLKARRQRAASGRQALCRRSVPPYAIFLLLLAAGYIRYIFPKLALSYTKRGPIGLHPHMLLNQFLIANRMTKIFFSNQKNIML